MSRLADVTGWTESAVTVVIGMLFSVLLELIGALLWYEALKQAATPSNAVTEPVTPVTDVVTDLHSAVAGGHVRVTVASIRKYVGCSQKRAMDLRKRFLAGENVTVLQ
jgi:hypothetical protein